MSLFSKQNMEALKTPLGMNNPVTVQVLGICSALAVTAQLKPAAVSFGTCSSVATIPTNMEAAESTGISKDIMAFLAEKACEKACCAAACDSVQSEPVLVDVQVVVNQ